MTISHRSNLLIKIDQAMDRSLALGWLNNIVDCALKLGLRVHDAICYCLGKNTQTSQKDYWNYLRQKKITQCVVGAFPVAGYFGIKMLKAREAALIDKVYGTFMDLKNQGRSTDMALVGINLEDQALLWKHPQFALMRLKEDPSHLQYIPVELLYDPRFMTSALKDGIGGKKLAEHIMQHDDLGLDAGYLANCLRDAGHDGMAYEMEGRAHEMQHPKEVAIEKERNAKASAGQKANKEQLGSLELEGAFSPPHGFFDVSLKDS